MSTISRSEWIQSWPRRTSRLPAWLDAASDGPGRGRTFTVRLPLPTVDAAEVSTGTPPETTDRTGGQPPPPPAAGKLRILLVEDHTATRRAMVAILTSLGHEVRAAGTLVEALGLAEGGGAFDLVISDLALPDGSGHDLMRRLKETRRNLHGVAISGFGMADDVRRSREAGFDEHLTKPVSRERLQEVLSHVRA